MARSPRRRACIRTAPVLALCAVVGATQACVTMSGRTLVWVDRLSGQEDSIDAGVRDFASPRLSPDGRLLLVEVESGDHDLWVYDLERGTALRLTVDPPADVSPLWTADGRSVVFGSARDGQASNLFRLPWDGSAPAQRLTSSPNEQIPRCVSPDNRELLFEEFDPDTQWDIRVVSLDEPDEIDTVLSSRFNERLPALSPDGRWLAYVADNTGRDEVYLRPFPGVNEALWMVSPHGGTTPPWSPDGRELFYREGESVKAVAVVARPSLALSRPELLFGSAHYVGEGRSYDVSPDGQFVMIRR